MVFNSKLDSKKTTVFESVSLSPLQKLGNYIASFAPNRLAFLHTRDEKVIEQTWQNDELVSLRVLKGEEAYAATARQIMTEPQDSVLERIEDFRNKNWLPKMVRKEVDELISKHRKGEAIDDSALKVVLEDLVPMASEPVDYNHCHAMEKPTQNCGSTRELSAEEKIQLIGRNIARHRENINSGKLELSPRTLDAFEKLEESHATLKDNPTAEHCDTVIVCSQAVIDSENCELLGHLEITCDTSMILARGIKKELPRKSNSIPKNDGGDFNSSDEPKINCKDGFAGTAPLPINNAKPTINDKRTDLRLEKFLPQKKL